MLEKYLELLKTTPVLRLNIKAEIEDKQKFYDLCKATYPSLFFGFSVDILKGWETVVFQLLSSLYNISKGSDIPSAVVLKQVKQKFGNLKVYVDVLDPLLQHRIDELIKAVSYIAETTCEFCGSCKDVSLFERGYVSRMCSSCLTMFCEYTVLDWVLNGNKFILNDTQVYCLKILRGEKPTGYFSQLRILQKEKINDYIPS